MLGLLALSACKGGKGEAGKEGRGKGAPSGSASGKKGGGLKFPVDVYPVELRRIEYSVVAPGTVEAFERVQVTARVAGAIDKVGFQEGQEVKKGDVLVIIDSARFQSSVASAKAALDKAEAAQRDAEAMIARREGAQQKNPGLIPGEELATFQTRGLTAKADTAVAREAFNAANLNLRDSRVRAPIDGVIQTRTVETGQYVNPGYVMATLLRADPMLLRFKVSPLEAPRMKPGMIADFRLRETDQTFQAKITLIAGAADAASRLIPVTAEVVTSENRFWLRPGAFCDVTVPVDGRREVIVVPRAAIRPSERGFVAYVIDGTVAHERVLSLGNNTKDGWVEVREGLSAGEKLVLRGAEPLSEGATVIPTDVAAPSSKAFDADGAGTAAPSAGPAPTATPSSSAGGRP